MERPELRKEAGFTVGEPSEEDIRATRENMRTRVLQAQRYPFAGARLDAPGGPTATLEIRLHGRRQAFEIPVKISRLDGTLRATDQVRIAQSRFGMEPFTAFGGTLKIQDEVEVRCDMPAHPVAGAPTPES